MNLLDIAVLAVLVLFVLHGIYRGFLPTLLSIGAYILAWLVAIVLLPVGSNAIRSNEKLFNTMLYYTEGSEYVGNVELSKTNINEISTDTLNDVFSNADLPYPVAKNIADNIAKEQFADSGIVTLGDYFNQTIVSLFINILVFLVLFALMRIVLAFIINGIDYAWTLPQLRMADRRAWACARHTGGISAFHAAAACAHRASGQVQVHYGHSEQLHNCQILL